MNDLVVVEHYHTGLPKRYSLDGFEFNWDDWVLCRVKLSETNVEHWCLASSFRGRSMRDFNCTLVNPSYEKMLDCEYVNTLAFFSPVKIIEEVNQ